MNINALSLVADIPLTMSSREIAELTGKRHDHVIRDIRAMLDALKDAPNLGDASVWEDVREDKDARGYTSAFHLNRELTDTLLTGYSIPLRRRVIARWHELEVQTAPLKPAELSRMDILRLAMESEEARIKAEAERDEAIRTKAQIGSRREATAMATAAAAKREASRLREQLGFNTRHATVIAVEKALKCRFGKQDWRQLKAWCVRNEVLSTKVHDPRWGEAVAWPAGAWLDVFGVNLAELFGEVAQ